MRFELTTSSLGSCKPSVTNQPTDNDLAQSQNIGMPKSMPSGHENDTKSGLSDTGTLSPEIATLADLLTALPDSDRAGIIADLPQGQRLAVARLIAKRITNA